MCCVASAKSSLRRSTSCCQCSAISNELHKPLCGMCPFSSFDIFFPFLSFSPRFFLPPNPQKSAQEHECYAAYERHSNLGWCLFGGLQGRCLGILFRH